MRLKHGDCLEVLKNIPDNSMDSIVTDPPYGLSFMNKKWDYDVPSTDIWVECLRVLKPGGHLLAFSGSRTYHRMAVRIEDAGFEIRDQIMWVYGSGFPKSHNIGKAVDKLQGNEREVLGDNPNHRTLKETNCMVGEPHSGDGTLTKGTTEWEGWGTALKPSHEPIVMARKPLSEKTVAENVLRWGTGGINIDDSRIDYKGEDDKWKCNSQISATNSNDGWKREAHDKEIEREANTQGRWPANIIFDEDAGQVLDQQSGISGGGKTTKQNRSRKGFMLTGSENNIQEANAPDNYGDKGGASRFFYCPKASKKDRDEGLDGFEDKELQQTFNSFDENGNRVREDGTIKPPIINKNNHPTVKPTALMEYLIKLVTPKGGTVLDCFLGSGSTGKAALRNGFDFIGIERDEEYIKIAEARIKNEIK